MKTKQLIYVVFLLISCNSKKDVSQKLKDVPKQENTERLDSVKWFFYVYSYEGKGLFKKDGKVTEFNPTDCETKIINVSKEGDSVFYEVSLYKEGYKFMYINEGFAPDGFYYHNGIFTPEMNMVRLDNFNNPEYVRKDNLKRDSLFKSFLKKTDSSKVFEWLKIERRKRKV